MAILAVDGFEQAELEQPKRALEQAGARAEIISLKPGKIQGMHHADKGDQFTVDKQLADVNTHDYDALLLPGGLMNPDTLRTSREAIDFVRSFADSGRPIAAICHAPWILIEAGIVSGRRLTSWPAIETDIRNAGGDWVDEPVVIDSGLITSRKPDDIPQFNATIIHEFAEGRSNRSIRRLNSHA